MDRSRWPPGPWDDEPDSVSWVSAVGLACEMRRGGFGIWCGYVGTQPDHPVWRLDAERILETHHGVTLVALSEEFPNGPPMPRGLKWAGFDCGHFGDVFPGMTMRTTISGIIYRDLAYVHAQCEFLAAQVDAVAMLEQAGFDVAQAPAWAMEYARRFDVPREERATLLRRLATDPVAAQLAESLGVPA